MGLEGNKAWVAPCNTTAVQGPQEFLNSTACKYGCRKSCGSRKQGMKCSPICFSCISASYTNVPEDIKNRPNLCVCVEDDLIITDDEVVEELLDEDADNDFEQEQFLKLT
ncbi:hypothetical protein AVEN_267150-1 [Araneus ventricosus]|uniref:Tesmin/TSO1-like CXC domain-containing protein n=1 Tax=Araneus ventricosus TaxID=182803 RepID=A0A4Y2N9M0_ARAVE|nr:hypothetical protein AVEN_267150-1 [Araneus ventricosus]